MKKIIAASILCASMFCVSCAEEGFVKVFECDADYPYFSAKTHLCYATDQDREDAEKKYEQEQQQEDASSDNSEDNE